MLGNLNAQLSQSSNKIKKIKLNFREETKTVKNISSFKDLVKFIFEVTNLEYSEVIAPGTVQSYTCDNCFNFWFEDAYHENFPLANEKDFQIAAATYANLSAIKIWAAENKPVIAFYLK